MSFVRIWIHAVWGTKHRQPILEPNLKKIICDHIIANAISKGFRIDSINGHLDHLHALMELHPEYSISKQMQLIKGESSFWMNKTNQVNHHFGWADEYFAESVSPKDIPAVRAYIKNQEEHHKKITFEQECKNVFATIKL